MATTTSWKLISKIVEAGVEIEITRSAEAILSFMCIFSILLESTSIVKFSYANIFTRKILKLAFVLSPVAHAWFAFPKVHRRV